MTPPTTDHIRQEYALLKVSRAMGDLRCGQPVLVLENKGSAVLAMAAEYATPATIERMEAIAESESFVAITSVRAKRLNIEIKPGRALRVKTDGLTHIDALIDPTLKKCAGAKLISASPATQCDEMVLKLLKASALLPAALVVDMRRREEAEDIALRHSITVIEEEDIAAYPSALAATLRLASEARVPLADAHDARVLAFRSRAAMFEHLAIVVGTIHQSQAPLVRVHSSCITGDVLASLRCDCGEQLTLAIQKMNEAGGGILLYLNQEGRGIGIVNKLRAYQLQDGGLDTVEANEEMGFNADERYFLPAAEILKQLGITQVRLLTNNPHKVTELQLCGINVTERVTLSVPAREENREYLETKAKRCGHLF